MKFYHFTKMAQLVTIICLLTGVSMYAQNRNVHAETLPGNLNSGWWEAHTWANVGSATATLSVTVYDESGETDVLSLSSLAPGNSMTILPQEIAGVGPAVDDLGDRWEISSDQPLAGIVAFTNEQVTANLGTDGGTAAGIYASPHLADTSTTLRFPVVKQNYFGRSSTFYVYNMDTSTADVIADFSWAGGAQSLTYPDVLPNRFIAVTPPSGMPASGDGTLGSLIVTSANQLAGAALEIETTGTSQTLKATRALSASDEANNLYVPSFKKSFGNPKFSSAIDIQGDAALSGNIIYTCYGANAEESGCTVGEAFAIPFTTNGANESYSAWPFGADHESLPDNSIYSAEIRVTSGGNAVAAVGETGALVGLPLDSAYLAFPSSGAGTSWSCPSHKERYFDVASGLVILPLSYPANVIVEFTVSDTSSSDKSLVGQAYTTNPIEITAGSTVFYDVANAVSPSGLTWDGSLAMPTSPGLLTAAVVTSDQPVVVISNEAVHHTVDRIVDGRQYSCFKID